MTTLDIDENVRQQVVRNGVPLLPPRSGAQPVTLAEVNRLRDREG